MEEDEEDEWGSSGDVKYHLGTTTDKDFENGHSMRLTILPNASHLESVSAMVLGKTKAL